MANPLPSGWTPEVLPSPLTSGFPWDTLVTWPPDEVRHTQSHQGFDAADLLLLDTAAAWWEAGHRSEHTVVLDDSWGALTCGLIRAQHGGRVRVAQDNLLGERALSANADELRLGVPEPEQVTGELFAGAQMVLMVLPRSLETLREWAELIAGNAASDVVVLCGGRDKHMNRSMNEVLGAVFREVSASRGRQKSRVLTARGPRRGTAASSASVPRRRDHDVGLSRPLRLVGAGAVYGGAKLDPGTDLMMRTLRQHGLMEQLTDGHAVRERRAVGASPVVDFGCGNGTVAAWTALEYPQVSVHAVDQSASAVRSAELTAAANGVAERVQVSRMDALEGFADDSAELILLNPPFHRGNAVDPGIAHRLFRDAGRVLAPGGRLVCVWNSHLRHRAALQQHVGPTRQLARNATFTVTESTREA